jgi:16S rRNA G966 N2-methylase RsmD
MSDLQGSKFDIISADPPYKSPVAKSVLHLVDRYNLLSDDGLLIIEHSKDTDLPLDKVSLTRTNKREYGQTFLSFFQKPDKPAQEQQ